MGGGGAGAIFPSQSLFFFKIKSLSFLNYLKFLFTHLFLAVLGLHCCAAFSLLVLSGGFSLVAVRELLVSVLFFLFFSCCGAQAPGSLQ